MKLANGLVCLAVGALLAGQIEEAGARNNNGADKLSGVEVTLSTPQLSASAQAGQSAQVVIEGTWSAPKRIKPHSVYLQARDPQGRFATPPVLSGTAGSNFSFTLGSLPTLAIGTYAGSIEIRACSDSACGTPYSGASDSAAYALEVAGAALADWETHQRNAAHQGYVPVTLDSSKFAKAWEWSRVIDDPIGGINPVVTSGGKVYVTTDVYFGQGVLYALNETDGTEAWRQSFGSVPALNPPAVSDGRVYTAVTGHSQTALWAFDSATGALLRSSPFEGQWPHLLAPTVHRGYVYTGSGYYGGTTYAFSTSDGTRAWSYTAGDDDMFTPAVDDEHVYQHTGTALSILNRSTGTVVATVADPFGFSTGYSYHGAPVLGGRGNVVAFAGDAFSGRASSNVEQYDQRVFSSFNIASRQYEWSTANAYLTAPAIAKGVIYAARNSPMSLDAIDEATGTVLWSWTPSGGMDTSFHRNIVVTDNLLFVSTDSTVYALDISARTPVWSHPEPGMLAISANQTLFIAPGARESDGRLVAIKLK